MIIDHIGLTVSNYQASKAFFTQALAPLDITLVKEVMGWGGFGKAGKPEFWFGEKAGPQMTIHVCFVADSREQVRQFYAAALRAGASDNGAPGVRAHYHPNYYGAYVIGPDGHNIEAVCHRPE